MDLVLLTTVKLLLKRNIKPMRLILGSIVGSLSLFFLFININSFTLFILKVVISIMMILVTFSYKNFSYFFKNLSYLYLVSIILGGSLYLLDNQVNYNNEGFIFFHNGLSINLIVIVIISPIILYLYLKEHRKIKTTVSNYHSVDVYLGRKKYSFNGYLDTGNKLYDPYKKRKVVLIYTNKIPFTYDKSILVSYNTLDNNGVIKCLKTNKIVIDDKYIFKDILIGESKKTFHIEGVDCILHGDLLEGIK